jgi:hypothetical protein
LRRRQDRVASVSAIKLNFHRLRDNPITLQVSDQLLSRGSRHSRSANHRQDRNAVGFLKKRHRKSNGPCLLCAAVPFDPVQAADQ